jgi:demethylmenaquinone methyltransferase/2-methoxy-6-polyprenyl-1,4-benzoquinol methylase
MTINPYNENESKKHQVELMFDNIAFRYDFLNHFLSGGVDFWWRSKAISIFKKALLKQRPVEPDLLDIATGTGDLAFSLKEIKPGKVVGLDLSQKMLDVAQNKLSSHNLSFDISFIKGDSEDLPFDNNSFDGICVAFGVRNFENLKKGLSEMNRVLNKGGVVMILEFSSPENTLFKSLYDFYLGNILPIIGKIVSRDQRAYKYLQESVQAFPSGKEFLNILDECGFTEAKHFPLSLGICSVYTAQK